MNTVEKLKILSAAGKYDVCASSFTKRKSKNSNRIGTPHTLGVCQATTPSGCVNLLKTLMTNACVHDCKYCVNSTHCSERKVCFEPQELAGLFMNFYLRNYVEGLFLSSGVAGDPDKTTEKMIETVKILRQKERFEGYVHLKVLPGVSRDKIKQLAELSDRLSINLETPNKSRFAEMSSTKDYKIDLLRRMDWIKEHPLPAGHTTQLVVGASEESDKEIMNMMHFLYKNMRLKRAYFSAFNPIKKTPLEKASKTPLLREHRLYQLDWLMRCYNFSNGELNKALSEDGFLSLGKDPKQVIAENVLKGRVNVNSATYEELIRVPGIGLTGAKRIMNLRALRKFETLNDLRKNGIVIKRATPYLRVEREQQVRLDEFAA